MKVEAKFRLIGLERGEAAEAEARAAFKTQYAQMSAKGMGDLYKEVFATGTTMTRDAQAQMAMTGKAGLAVAQSASELSKGNIEYAKVLKERADIEVMALQSNKAYLQNVIYTGGDLGDAARKNMKDNDTAYHGMRTTMKDEKIARDDINAALVKQREVIKAEQDARKGITTAMITGTQQMETAIAAFMERVVGGVNRNQKLNDQLLQTSDKFSMTKPGEKPQDRARAYVQAVAEEKADPNKPATQQRAYEETIGKNLGVDKFVEFGANVASRLIKGVDDVVGNVLSSAKEQFNVTNMTVTNFTGAQRHTGTLGETGGLTEPKDIIAKLKKGETVMTPEQLKNAMKGAENKGIENMLSSLQSKDMAKSGSLDISKIAAEIRTSISKVEVTNWPSSAGSAMVSQVAKPTEPKPTEPKPTGPKPAESKPTESKPTESNSAQASTPKKDNVGKKEDKEEYYVNGKPASKAEFDAATSKNPAYAAMLGQPLSLPIKENITEKQGKGEGFDPKKITTIIQDQITSSIQKTSGGGVTEGRLVKSDDAKAAEQELSKVKVEYNSKLKELYAQMKEQLGPDAKPIDVRRAVIGSKQRTDLEDEVNSQKEALRKRIDEGTTWEITKRAEANESIKKISTEQSQMIIGFKTKELDDAKKIGQEAIDQAKEGSKLKIKVEQDYNDHWTKSRDEAAQKITDLEEKAATETLTKREQNELTLQKNLKAQADQEIATSAYNLEDYKKEEEINKRRAERDAKIQQLGKDKLSAVDRGDQAREAMDIMMYKGQREGKSKEEIEGSEAYKKANKEMKEAYREAENISKEMGKVITAPLTDAKDEIKSTSEKIKEDMKEALPVQGMKDKTEEMNKLADRRTEIEERLLERQGEVDRLKSIAAERELTEEEQAELKLAENGVIRAQNNLKNNLEQQKELEEALGLAKKDSDDKILEQTKKANEAQVESYGGLTDAAIASRDKFMEDLNAEPQGESEIYDIGDSVTDLTDQIQGLHDAQMMEANAEPQGESNIVSRALKDFSSQIPENPTSNPSNSESKFAPLSYSNFTIGPDGMPIAKKSIPGAVKKDENQSDAETQRLQRQNEAKKKENDDKNSQESSKSTEAKPSTKNLDDVVRTLEVLNMNVNRLIGKVEETGKQSVSAMKSLDGNLYRR